MLRRVIFACHLLFLLSTGCALPLPANTPEPYDKHMLLSIVVGESTSETVASLLGQPDVQLDGGKIWLYGETRMVTVDGLSHEYQSFLVFFDKGFVAYYGVLESKYGCWSLGLCLVSGWSEYPIGEEPIKLDRERTALVSQREDDLLAKNFTPGKEECGLFFYKDDRAFISKGYTPSITSGAVKDEPLHYKGYIFQRVTPGFHTFKVEDKHKGYVCEGGSLLYFEVRHDYGWNGADASIHPVNEDDGRSAISQRHLLITW